MQDSSCYVNARDLKTGGFLWDSKRCFDSVFSSVSVQDGQLYYSGSKRNCVSMTAGPAGGLVKWYLNGDDNYYEGYTQQVPANNDDIDWCYATPALLKERGRSVFHDWMGHLFCVNREALLPNNPTIEWDVPILGSEARTQASPLVAPGTTPDTFVVYLIGSDRLIHVIDADTGLTTGPGTLGDPNGYYNDGTLNSGGLSSLAAWNGRLFVETPSVYPAPAGTAPPARVLCYGR